MRIDNPSISGSLSFIGGTNSISATSVSLTGSLTGTFEGAFSSTATANISGAFNSVSESLASERLKNTTDTLTGDLTVTGKITAQEFHTEFVSASIIYESGSTQFGNSADDTHIFTGNVGIGVNTPTAKLHVNQPNHNEDTIGYASSTALWRLRNETVSGNPTGRLSLYDNGTVTVNVEGSAGRVTYFNAGNVGIGETTPGHKLDIKGSDAYLVNINNTATDARLQFERNGTAYGHMSAGADLFTMYGNPGTSLRFMPGGSTAMYIQAADGNVGIGTTSATQKLHVEGSGIFGTSIYRSSLDGSSAGAFLRYGTLADPDSLGTIGTYSSAMMYETAQSGGHVFSTGAGVNGTERLRIDNSGHLNINGGNIVLRNSSLFAPLSGYLKEGFVGNNDGILSFAVNGASNGEYGQHSFQVRKGDSSDPIEAIRIQTSGNVGIGMNSPSHKLEVNGPTKSSYFTSNVNTTKSGLGPRDWTLIGPEDGSASRASALQIGDVSGAKYAIAGGDYDLSFYKHVSAPDSYARAFYISGTNAGDSEPNFVVDNKLYNNGKYYYSDGGLLLKKMVSVGDNTTTTLLTIDSAGSYSCIGGGELLIVFVDAGSPWGVYVWKGLLSMRTVQFGSMYSSGIQMIDSRNNLDGTFTVSSSTSKTSGVADGKLIVTATTSSGISGTAHVSFNGWTTGGAQPY